MSIIHKILVATDFSETSQKAIDYATSIAKNLNAQLDVVTVVDPSALDFGVLHFTIGGISKWVEEIKDFREIAEKKMHYLETSVTGEKFILDGNPGKKIVKYLEENDDYDLVILGSHGYGNLDRFVLGSVSEYVTRKAPCSTMIVKGDI
ncbi:universal stress protein [Candidatus Uabimicrobium sp. HlEnr_7]|uniref:universal stress protein n=1 Tax=Candidatus Uabimicrobium helgolandensis TaxID=3095367 RepID=UPI0035585103